MYVLWLKIKCWHLKCVAHKTWKVHFDYQNFWFMEIITYGSIIYIPQKIKKSSHACSSLPFSLRNIAVLKVRRWSLFTKGPMSRLMTLVVFFISSSGPTIEFWDLHNSIVIQIETHILIVYFHVIGITTANTFWEISISP